MPYHRSLDMARESRKTGKKIGTTGRGIGPAYEDKVARVGIRFCDLLDDMIFREKLKSNVEEKNFFLTKLFGEAPWTNSRSMMNTGSMLRGSNPMWRIPPLLWKER